MLTLVNEADVSPELDRAIREFLGECFPADREAFSRVRPWHGCAAEYSVLGFEGDRVWGHVAVVRRMIRCGQTPVDVAGIQSLAVGPAFRGRGLGKQLMVRAVQEAKRRGIPVGLLFCAPELETYYGSQGWATLRRPITMHDAEGRRVSIPEKNIGMWTPLGDQTLPPGEIDIQGRDW